MNITVTWVPDPLAPAGEGLMILAHDSGCVEVVSCTFSALVGCSIAELNYYLRGGRVEHRACEFDCIARHPDTDIIQAASVYADPAP